MQSRNTKAGITLVTLGYPLPCIRKALPKLTGLIGRPACRVVLRADRRHSFSASSLAAYSLLVRCLLDRKGKMVYTSEDVAELMQISIRSVYKNDTSANRYGLFGDCQWIP